MMFFLGHLITSQITRWDDLNSVKQLSNQWSFYYICIEVYHLILMFGNNIFLWRANSRFLIPLILGKRIKLENRPNVDYEVSAEK